jgi:hypothetical protein
MIDAELLADLRHLLDTLRLPEWQRDLIKTCPDDLMKSIVEDNRRGGDIHGRASAFPKATNQPSEERPRSNNGWADSPEIKPPPGVSLIDAMCAQEDLNFRLQRIKELGEAAAVQRALTEAQGKAQAEQPKPKDKGK